MWKMKMTFEDIVEEKEEFWEMRKSIFYLLIIHSKKKSYNLDIEIPLCICLNLCDKIISLELVVNFFFELCNGSFLFFGVFEVVDVDNIEEDNDEEGLGFDIKGNDSIVWCCVERGVLFDNGGNDKGIFDNGEGDTGDEVDVKLFTLFLLLLLLLLLFVSLSINKSSFKIFWYFVNQLCEDSFFELFSFEIFFFEPCR